MIKKRIIIIAVLTGFFGILEFFSIYTTAKIDSMTTTLVLSQLKGDIGYADMLTKFELYKNILNVMHLIIAADINVIFGILCYTAYKYVENKKYIDEVEKIDKKN